VAGEYLNMAATLIRLKARELLPDSEPEDLGGDADGIYSREQLIAMMLEYKKYKEAAGALRGFEARTFGAYARGQAEDPENLVAPESGGNDVTLGNVSIFDLITAFKSIVERAAVDDDANHVVEVDSCRIDDRIEHVLTVLSDAGREMRFQDLFVDDKRKIALVVTFMALLELVKMRQVRFRQEAVFGEIFVIRSVGGDRD
jgi:segregation and condensation protein A